jgi:hypothetical protein
LILFYQIDTEFLTVPILTNKLLTLDEILTISANLKDITTKEKLMDFLLNKKESKDDESVYLSQKEQVNLSFDEIKTNTILTLKKI